MKRLSPDAQDPRFRLFLLELSNATHIDALMLAEWIRANLDWLRPDFAASNEPDDQVGAWTRMQFVHRTRVHA